MELGVNVKNRRRRFSSEISHFKLHTSHSTLQKSTREGAFLRKPFDKPPGMLYNEEKTRKEKREIA